jgi:hypothetical protein
VLDAGKRKFNKFGVHAKASLWGVAIPLSHGEWILKKELNFRKLMATVCGSADLTGWTPFP